MSHVSDLVLVHVVLQLCLAQLVEGDDDEGDEDVDEEEGEDDEEDDVEDGHLHAEPGHRALVLVRRRHRVLQDAVEKKATFPEYEMKYYLNFRTHATHPSDVCTANNVSMAMKQLS